MAQEPADVLIIGAGASGGVVAKRLARGRVRRRLPRARASGSTAPTTRATSSIGSSRRARTGRRAPTSAGLAQDYPIVEDDTPVSPLMYNAVGGSTIIFAGAWPRALPSDFRVRSLDGVADDWPIDYFELLPYFYRTDRDFGVSGLAGRPGLPARHRGRADAAAADRVGRAQGRSGHDQARLALVARVQLDQLGRLRRSPAVRPTQHLPVRLQRGRQGLDRPDPLAQGDRQGRAARDRRARPPHRDRRQGARDRRDLDRPRRGRALPAGEGRRRRRECDRDAPAVAAVGAARSTRTAWPTRPALSGSG